MGATKRSIPEFTLFISSSLGQNTPNTQTIKFIASALALLVLSAASVTASADRVLKGAGTTKDPKLSKPSKPVKPAKVGKSNRGTVSPTTSPSAGPTSSPTASPTVSPTPDPCPGNELALDNTSIKTTRDAWLADKDAATATYDMESLFDTDVVNTATFNEDLTYWDTSGATKMTWMFYSCDAFNGDVSQWDVSSVTDMRGMFNGASGLIL
jgi:surface protein